MRPTLHVFILIFAVSISLTSMSYAQDTTFRLPPSALNLEDPSPSPTDPVLPSNEITATGADLGYSKPAIRLKLDALLWGRNVEDNFFHSNAALTYLDPRLEATLNSWLELDLQISGYFVAGDAKNFYTTEGESSNGIYLEEAAANFRPLDQLQVRGGALYITMNPILSIMSQNTFMGTDQKYSLVLDPVTISAYSLESVPSSGTVTRGLIDDAPDAYFMSQTLEVDLKLAGIGTIFKAAATHYDFGNLSSNIASDSQLIGNSVTSFTGIGPNTRFTIGFEGFETAAAIDTDWGKRFSTEFTGSVIKNDEALPGNNTGTQFGAAITTKFEKYNLIPSAVIYNMGADVTPATYTILPFRYQDRTGFMAMLKFELKKEKINFFGSFTRGDVINPNPYLADRDIYSLGMEAKYDIL